VDGCHCVRLNSADQGFTASRKSYRDKTLSCAASKTGTHDAALPISWRTSTFRLDLLRTQKSLRTTPLKTLCPSNPHPSPQDNGRMESRDPNRLKSQEHSLSAAPQSLRDNTDGPDHRRGLGAMACNPVYTDGAHRGVDTMTRGSDGFDADDHSMAGFEYWGQHPDRGAISYDEQRRLGYFYKLYPIL
jgi:hypothetical protein